MAEIAIANLNRVELAPRITLRGGGRRRLDRLIAGRLKHLRGEAIFVSVHRPGEIFALTNDSVRLAEVPADVAPHERHLFEERLWSRTYVGPRDTVLITIAPRGGGANSGRKIGLTIAAIAIMVFAQWAGPAAAGALTTAGALQAGTLAATIAAKVVTAGIMIGGAAVLAAFARQGNKDEKLYGVSGGGNLARANERIPILCGRAWSVPDLSQPDWFTYDGDDMTLMKRMTLTCGKARIKKMRVGQTILWEEVGSNGLPNGGATTSGVKTAFTGTQVEFIYGTASTLVPGDVISSPSVTGQTLPLSNHSPNISGPWAVTPVGVQVNKLQVDYSFPAGYWKTNTGTSLPIDLWFEYAPINDAGDPTGAWQTLYRFTSGAYKQTSPKRFTKFKDVPLGRYAVRGRNNNPDMGPDNEAKYQRAISWDGLRGHTPDTRTREGITEICLKIKSGKSLTSTQFANIEVYAERLGDVWNGTAFEEGVLRKCPDLYADALINEFYGGNIDPSLVDLAKVRAYTSTLPEFDTFDGVVRGPDTLWNACKVFLANMRAEPVRIGSGYSFVRDEPKALRRHTFSRRQIVRGTTAVDYDIEADDGSADVQINFHKDTDPKQPYNVRATYGVESALGPRRIDWPGLSSYDHATHIARWLAASGFYRRARVAFETEMDGRLVMRGDPIAVDPWYLSGRSVSGVLSASGNTLTLDSDVQIVPGDYAMLRDRGGQEWGPVRVTQGVDARHVVLNYSDVTAEATSTGLALAAVLAPDTANPTTIVIGPLAEHGEQWLVESCLPKDNGRTSLVAKIDSAAVYDAIDADIPADSPLTWSFKPNETPAVNAFGAKIFNDGTVLTLSFAVQADPGAVRYEVFVSFDGGTEYVEVYDGTAASARVTISFTDTDVLAKARAYGSTGVPGEFTTPTAIEVPKPIVVATDLEPGIATLDKLGADATSIFASELESLLGATAEFVAREQETDQHKASFGNAMAAITTTRQLLASGDAALADQITAVTASLNAAFASSSIRFTSVVAPSGIAARIAMEVKAGVTGSWSSAGIYIDVRETSPGAGTYFGTIGLVADIIYAENAAGTVRRLLFDANAQIGTQSIAPGTVGRFLSYARTSNIAQDIGVGAVNVSVQHNDWKTDYIGDLAVVENAAGLVSSPVGKGFVTSFLRLRAYGAAAIGIPGGTYANVEFTILARRSGYADVELASPPFAYSTYVGGNLAANVPSAFDLGIAPLDVGTWSFYTAWRWAADHASITATISRPAIVGTAIIQCPYR